MRVAAFAATTVLGTVGCGRSEKSDPPRPNPAPAETATVPEAVPEVAHGEALYTQYCAMCHMADGGGVPNFQPPIAGSPVAKGNVAKLEAVIRAGSAVLKDRENPFGNEMPPFGHLSDGEIKALVEYVHATFGPSGAR
jgi:mono/diheme cytochrome c family protein